MVHQFSFYPVMTGFFEELKRRKVYRVAIAYVVMSWALAQGLAQVLPVFDVPNSVVRITIAVMLIGFPFALALAWVFDITPQGIRATSTPSVPVARRRRNLILLIAIGVIISAAASFFLLPRASARKIDKSIAVLPFENLSAEKENAYFADGIQDDILTNLSKIGDLRVISRMSVMSYRGDGVRNAREIGKALGVGTLLEGSVRRAGNRVRVSVQLINANNDEHIWAEDFDRDVTDVFAIQTDLAHRIADALQAKLSSNEKARLGQIPTNDSEAYLLFIQGQDLAKQPDQTLESSAKAEGFFEEAIKRDRTFAAAFAGLSLVESSMYHSLDPTPVHRDKARAAAHEALRLQPDLPEAHLALGFSYYYGDRDYNRALAEFEVAKKGLPNEAQAFLAIGAIQRRQGKWTESTVNLEKAAALDPKNASVLINLAFNYMAQRKFDTADKILDRAIFAAPQSASAHALKGYAAALRTGDFSGGESQLAALPPSADSDGAVTSERVWSLSCQRKYAEALQTLHQFPGDVLRAFDSSIPKSFLEGVLNYCEGDKPKAQAAFEQARAVAERLVRESPDDAPRRAMLGQILAALGQKEAAIAEGKRAVALLPESEDAFGGTMITLGLAQIYTWVGEHAEAIRLLDHLLEVPSGVTVPLLKVDPAWDPLRKDPGFQALIDKYGAKR
jgi:TolB-like protein/Flp pilus assembly protein TadD